jgi:hypothetical protein
MGRLLPLNIKGDLTVGITAVNIVAVPSGSFLTRDQIDRLRPPAPTPPLLRDAPPGSTVINYTPERDAGPVVNADEDAA